MTNENEPIQPKKNKGGRPKKDKKGALLWVSAEFVDSMTAYLDLLKQQQQRQAKQ